MRSKSRMRVTRHKSVYHQTHLWFIFDAPPFVAQKLTKDNKMHRKKLRKQPTPLSPQFLIIQERKIPQGWQFHIKKVYHNILKKKVVAEPGRSRVLRGRELHNCGATTKKVCPQVLTHRTSATGGTTRRASRVLNHLGVYRSKPAL